MLGYNRTGLNGSSSGNRSNENFIEENADRYGNQDEIAIAFNRQGMENIVIDDSQVSRENYYASYFLDIHETTYQKPLQESNQNQISFDLVDLVLSTQKLGK